jgi:hypothetical protein
VELILRKLADGATEAELLHDYPHLTTEDIRAAVAYGAASVAHEEVVLLPDTSENSNGREEDRGKRRSGSDACTRKEKAPEQCRA